MKGDMSSTDDVDDELELKHEVKVEVEPSEEDSREDPLWSVSHNDFKSEGEKSRKAVTRPRTTRERKQSSQSDSDCSSSSKSDSDSDFSGGTPSDSDSSSSSIWRDEKLVNIDELKKERRRAQNRESQRRRRQLQKSSGQERKVKTTEDKNNPETAEKRKLDLERKAEYKRNYRARQRKKCIENGTPRKCSSKSNLTEEERKRILAQKAEYQRMFRARQKEKLIENPTLKKCSSNSNLTEEERERKRAQKAETQRKYRSSLSNLTEEERERKRARMIEYKRNYRERQKKKRGENPTPRKGRPKRNLTTEEKEEKTERKRARRTEYQRKYRARQQSKGLEEPDSPPAIKQRVKETPTPEEIERRKRVKKTPTPEEIERRKREISQRQTIRKLEKEARMSEEAIKEMKDGERLKYLQKKADEKYNRRRQEWAKARHANLSAEERQKKREYVRKWRENWTEEQYKKHLAKVKECHERLKQDPEKWKAKRERQKERDTAMREKKRKMRAEGIEENPIKKFLKKRVPSTTIMIGGLTKRELCKAYYNRNRIAKETPEGREKRLMQARLNEAKRKRRIKLVETGASAEQIEMELKEFEATYQPTTTRVLAYRPRLTVRNKEVDAVLASFSGAPKSAETISLTPSIAIPSTLVSKSHENSDYDHSEKVEEDCFASASEIPPNETTSFTPSIVIPSPSVSEIHENSDYDHSEKVEEDDCFATTPLQPESPPRSSSPFFQESEGELDQDDSNILPDPIPRVTVSDINENSDDDHSEKVEEDCSAASFQPEASPTHSSSPFFQESEGEVDQDDSNIVPDPIPEVAKRKGPGRPRLHPIKPNRPEPSPQKLSSKTISKVICDVCGELYYYKYIQLHKNKFHHPNFTPDSKGCSLCPTSGPFKNGPDFYKNHWKPVHEKIVKEALHKPFVCHECGASFKGNAGLRHHRDSKHSDDLALPCQHCEKVLSNRRSLYTHIFRIHGNMSRYDCLRCEIKCASKDELKAHVAEVHPESYFPCGSCSALLYTLGTKLNHYKNCKKMKNSEKKIVDEKLRNKVMHKMPGNCEVCEKSILLTSLSKHYQEVHGILNEEFKCWHLGCDRSFKRRDYWAAHLEMVHLEDLEDEGVKDKLRMYYVKDRSKVVIKHPEPPPQGKKGPWSTPKKKKVVGKKKGIRKRGKRRESSESEVEDSSEVDSSEVEESDGDEPVDYLQSYPDIEKEKRLVIQLVRLTPQEINEFLIKKELTPSEELSL